MSNEKERIDSCVECCVRNRDFSKKKVYNCSLCGRWFCETHLEPKMVFIKDLKLFEDTQESRRNREIRTLYETEILGKEGKGHPDFGYSRRKFIELKMGEKRLNELKKRALDRMDHYYDEVETLEKPADTEADRKKRVETLLEQERAIENEEIERKKLLEADVVETKSSYHFLVPRQVYSNPEYREYLDHADNLKSVKNIVDEYYRKYPFPMRKGLEKPKKKEHSWRY